MMEGWKEYRLGDVSEKIQYGYTESAVKEDIGPKFLRITDIVNEIIKWEEVPHCPINEKDLAKYKLKKGDIVVARTGNTTGYAKLIRTDIEAVFASYLIRFKIDTKIATPEFIGRLVESDIFKGYVWSIIGGSAQPGANAKFLSSFKIDLPPLTTQRKIANILSAYDDLIINNLKRIKLLEETAQNEFNEWYANNEDFEEVNLGSIIGHEIGGGWGAEEQSDEFSKPAYVIRGTDIDELPNGKLEKVPFRFHKKSNLASRNLQDGDIIFEVSGGSSYEGVAKTLLVTDELLKQFDNAVMPASFCKLARPIDRKYSSFLFLFWRFLRNIKGTEVFEIRSASNIVNYNWTAFLKFQKIKKPSETELERFNNKVEPIYKQVYKLGNQNQYLKEARDILLPRLMTGMIDVDKLSGQVESEMERELDMAAVDGGEYKKS